MATWFYALPNDITAPQVYADEKLLYAAVVAVRLVVGGRCAKQSHHDSSLRVNSNCSDNHLSASFHYVRTCVKIQFTSNPFYFRQPGP